MEPLVLSPSDFVAVLNQTLEIAYPIVAIEGEISNFRIAKEKWIYFDVKDEMASLRCFGTVFNLRMPLEDGMMVRLIARPELHPLYNFSLQVSAVAPVGEGSIKKAADILKTKLEIEGLFDLSRKRPLPYPPEKIGLVTSNEAAAYGDFIKVVSARWPLVDISLINVKVQGDQAAGEIVSAIHKFNQTTDVEVLVVIRGGGSADDLLAFQEENLVRAIAESRIPTIVAIGHERDISLAELAADQRASTPSNAAELLVPDKKDVIMSLRHNITGARDVIKIELATRSDVLRVAESKIRQTMEASVLKARYYVSERRTLLEALNPQAVLRRGFALVRLESKVVRSRKQLKAGDTVSLTFHDGESQARVIG